MTILHAEYKNIRMHLQSHYVVLTRRKLGIRHTYKRTNNGMVYISKKATTRAAWVEISVGTNVQYLRRALLNYYYYWDLLS
jgi:hypothetical protein